MTYQQHLLRELEMLYTPASELPEIPQMRKPDFFIEGKIHKLIRKRRHCDRLVQDFDNLNNKAKV